MQTSQPNFFIPAVLKSTTDFYHFVLLSLTLTVPGGLKVSAKQGLLASFSHFYVIKTKFNVVIKQFKVNILRTLLSKIYRNKGNTMFYRLC